MIALFKDIRAGRHTKQGPWTEFQLAPGEYDEIERQLGRDEALSGYIKDKTRCVCAEQVRDWLMTARAVMITTERFIGLSFACRPEYMNSSSMELRTQSEVS